MFGVVVCPRCGRAKGIELPKKTTTCPCGFTIRVNPSRIRQRATTARELAPLVGRVNAELRGGLAEVEATARPKKRTRDAYARVVAVASRAGNRRQRTRRVAEELVREFGVFSRQDWRRVLEALEIPGADEQLEELLNRNVVYEPRPGSFRIV